MIRHLCPQLFTLLGAAFLCCLGTAAFGAIEADVACCYAPSYATSVGGEDNAQVLIANAIIGNNVVNDQSGTGAHMRIAGFYQSTNDPKNYTTTGGMVGWLNSSNANVSDVVNYGSAVGADLVTYVCQNSDSSTIAAVSNQPGMYSALNPAAVYYVVVAHEVGGHNYGRAHSDGVLNPKTVMLHNYCGGGANGYFTNPNIWLNGIQLLGPGNVCSMGALINAGDNSQPTADSAQGVANRRDRVVVGPNLSNVVRRWSFTNAAGSAPAGTTVADQVAGASAIVRGNGATFTGKALRIPGGSTGNVAMSAMSAYIDLPNGVISSRTNITIEIWATPLSAPTWARICDFGRTVQAGDGLGAAGEYTGALATAAPGTTQASDNLTLSAANATSIATQRFEAKLNGGTAFTLDAGLATTAGVQHHYAITFADGVGSYGSAGGRWQWYRDGDAITFLDVNFHLSDIEDVNNWLGRSMYSADALSNNEYAEVRISSVALTRGEVLANYLLGPNYVSVATATLAGSDAAGATSFNTAGQWNNGAAPSSANVYETFGYSLRTPAASSSYTFVGSSLAVSGGTLIYKGTASSTLTINSLTLKNGTVSHAGSGVFTMAGNLALAAPGGTFNGTNGTFNLTANLSGSGPLTLLAGATTLAGTNTGFTGKILVGNGVAGTLVIDSPARLGANPAVYTADQLTFNRGTLQTTATLTLNDPNRGVLLDVSGGKFNVAAGTTLTLAEPLSSPSAGSNVAAGSLNKTGAGTLVLGSTSSTFNGTLYVDTGSTSASDGVVRVTTNQVLASAHSPIFINNNNSGSSTLQLDGTSANLTLPQRVYLNGRTNSAPAIQSVAGTNTVGGLSIWAGGSSYIVQSDGGTLNFNASLTSGATGSRTITFQGNGNFAALGSIDDGTATPLNITKLGNGALTLTGAGTLTGTTTISAGSFVLNGSLSAAAGTMSTAAGTTLSGTGSAATTTTVGGTHAPGNGVGSQSFTGTLNYAAAARLKWALVANSAATAASNQVSGGTVSVASGAGIDLIFNGAGSGVNFFDAFWTQSRSWTVLGSTALSGAFTLGSVSLDSTGRTASNYGTFSLSQSATGVVLNWLPNGYTAWRGANFGVKTGDPLVSDYLANPDSDALPNVWEYFFGTNPNVAAASPLQSQIVGGHLTLTFPRNTAAKDVTVTVQGTDVLGGPWVDLARSTNGNAFIGIAPGANVMETGADSVHTVIVQDVYAVTDPSHSTRFFQLKIQ